MEKKRNKLKVVPDRETLEEFLNPSSPVRVTFNTDLGRLEWTPPRDSTLGEPKTEQGWKWRRLK